MSSEHALLDADFEALLREVAANPRSSLLRVERPRMLPELFDERTNVSRHAAGLTAAERHLLQVHRGEVAWLLREACMIKLIEGPRHRRYVSPYSGPGKKVELLSDRQLAQRAQESEDASSDSIECLDGLELLKRCVADRVGEEPNVAELATASLRLEASDQARLMVGASMLMSAPRAALSLLANFMIAEPVEQYVPIAWEYRGRAFTSMGCSVEAHDAYVRASEHRHGRVWSRLSRLVLGMQLAMKDDVLECARYLSDSIARDDPIVDCYTRSLEDQRRLQEWTPTAAGAQLATSLRGSLGEVGRKVGNAFL